MPYLTEKEASLAAREAEDAKWLQCPGCLQDRRHVDGVIVDHREYHADYGMIPCSGSGMLIAVHGQAANPAA